MLGSKLDILKKEWIDVVFAGRNKNYGAYDLRRSNSRNTNRALFYGVVFFVLVISLKTIINKIQGFIPDAEEKVELREVILETPPEEKKEELPPPEEPPKPPNDVVKFPPPIVKPDNEVKEEPPTIAELKVADPGQDNIKGDPNAQIVIDEPVGNNDQKAVTEDVNQVYTVLEVQPKYPGGTEKFLKYLGDNIKYPAADRENNLQGRVVLQFVVERDGTLTDVKAIRGPSQAMMDEAARVARRSTKWAPGIQNGRPVRAQFTVPINFTLGEE
jgi:protein TonB